MSATPTIRIEDFPAAVILYDAGLKMIDANKAALQLLGYDSITELKGKWIKDVLNVVDHSAVMQLLKNPRLVPGKHLQQQVTHVNKYGDNVEVLAQFAVLQNEQNSGRHLITETCMPAGNAIKKLKERIRSKAHYKMLVENVPGLEMTLVNKDYKIISTVGAEMRKLGLSAVEDENDTLITYYDERIVTMLKPLLKIAFNATPVSREFKVENAYFSVRIIPMLDDKAKTQCMIVFQDITESKLAEQKLKLSKKEAEEATEARGNFIAKMSHEIRTPLNAIIGFSDQLAKTKLSKKQSEFLDVVLNSSRHLLSIVDEILVISRIDSEEIKIDEEPFAVTDVLEAVHGVVEMKYREKKLKYNAAVDPALTKKVLLGDAPRLRQVLINLVNNAIKFTHQGEVRLGCTISDEIPTHMVLDFEVQDTGIGIGEVDIEKIFKPFHQVDESVSRTFSGTGLGLTISKEIIEKMGGALKVKSKLGVGSVFSFSVQFKKSKPKTVLPAQSHLKSIELPDQFRLLFVDDDPMNRLLGKAVLIDLKVKYDMADSGRSALEMFKPGKYDVILLDINMPGFSGIEVAEEMRKLESENAITKRSRILAMTANVFKEHIRNYLNAGMDDVMLKPFNEETLIEKLNKHSSQIAAPKTENKQHKSHAGKNYDLTQLKRIVKGDKTFLLDMLSAFIENSQSQLDRIEQAFHEQNYPEIGEAAHRLLPSVEQLGMHKATNVLKKLEEHYLRKETYALNEKLVESAIAEIKCSISAIVNERKRLLNHLEE